MGPRIFKFVLIIPQAIPNSLVLESAKGMCSTAVPNDLRGGAKMLKDNDFLPNYREY